MTILKTSILYKLNLVGTNDPQIRNTIQQYNHAHLVAYDVLYEGLERGLTPSNYMRVVKDLAYSVTAFVDLLERDENRNKLSDLADEMEIRPIGDCCDYIWSQITFDMIERCNKLKAIIQLDEQFEISKRLNASIQTLTKEEQMTQFFESIPQLNQVEDLVLELNELACRLDHLYEEKVVID